MVPGVLSVWEGWNPEPTTKRLPEGALPGGRTPWPRAAAIGRCQGGLASTQEDAGVQSQDRRKTWRDKVDRDQDRDLAWRWGVGEGKGPLGWFNRGLGTRTKA